MKSFSESGEAYSVSRLGEETSGKVQRLDLLLASYCDANQSIFQRYGKLCPFGCLYRKDNTLEESKRVITAAVNLALNEVRCMDASS